MGRCGCFYQKAEVGVLAFAIPIAIVLAIALGYAAFRRKISKLFSKIGS